MVIFLKEDVRDEIEMTLTHAEFELKENLKVYHDYQLKLKKLVGYYAEHPYFQTEDDYEAVMCRLVRILDIDDSFGFRQQWSKSELWIDK